MPDYVTQAEAIAACPKLATNPELAALITDASDAVSLYTGRTFGLTSQTELHDGDNRPRLWLRETPVLLVSSITINGTALDNTNGDAWTVNARTGELVRGNGQSDPRFAPWFPKGHQNVSVAYTAGGLTLPHGVKRSVLLVLKMLADTMKVDGRMKSEEIGDYSYEVGDPSSLVLPPVARFLLNQHVSDWIA